MAQRLKDCLRSNDRFETSGAYALQGALAPVKIDFDRQVGTYDFDRQVGTYEEPNVWVSYAV